MTTKAMKKTTCKGKAPAVIVTTTSAVASTSISTSVSPLPLTSEKPNAVEKRPAEPIDGPATKRSEKGKEPEIQESILEQRRSNLEYIYLIF
jgi:cell division septation protein DedD